VHSFKYSELAGYCSEGKSLKVLSYCLTVRNSQCIELMSKLIRKWYVATCRI